MKLIAYGMILLVILEESYCKTTSSVNKTSTSWGYDYNLSDTRGFKVKHDDKGYQFEPIYKDTSSALKKHYNSRSIYDQFTSPEETNDSQPHSSTNDVINSISSGTISAKSNGAVNSLPEGDKVPNEVILDTSTNGGTTTKFRRVPVTKTHTVTVTETQTEAPIATDKTSFEAPRSSHRIPAGDIKGIVDPYGSQNTPMYAAPTDPLYYPQAPLYGQIYGPADGSMYGISNGQMYWPPVVPTYGPPTGGMYGPTGPNYGLPTRSEYGYASQNVQMYGPSNGQMYVPQNGQSNGYPTGSLYGSNRYY